MSLDYVKTVLNAASHACNNSGVRASLIGQKTSEINAAIARLKTELEEARQHLIRAINELSDQRALVISATAGHGRPAPSVGLGQLDQANRRLEEQRSKISQGIQALEAAWSLINPVANELDAANVFARGAAKTFDQYRTSF